MYLFFKRFFDIFISFILIVILLPLFIIILIAVTLFNKGEIIFLQERIGINNKKFSVYKFSTMLKNSVNMPGGPITTRNDPRVTPVGKILRMTKLNELPQIFNVLIGDMSFVGPRPVVQIGFDMYPDNIKETIYRSKPGITGIGSIVFRDEEKLVSESELPPIEFYKRYIFPYKGELEIWYQDHANFWLDIKILFLTAWIIIFPKSKLYEKWFKDLPKRNY